MPKIMIMAISSPSPGAPPATGGGGSDYSSCLADKVAVAFAEWPVGLVARRGGHQLEVVPRPLALGWLLHLEQERRRQIAAILTNRGLAEAIIFHRHLLHA